MIWKTKQQNLFFFFYLWFLASKEWNKTLSWIFLSPRLVTSPGSCRRELEKIHLNWSEIIKTKIPTDVTWLVPFFITSLPSGLRCWPRCWGWETSRWSPAGLSSVTGRSTSGGRPSCTLKDKNSTSREEHSEGGWAQRRRQRPLPACDDGQGPQEDVHQAVF